MFYFVKNNFDNNNDFNDFCYFISYYFTNKILFIIGRLFPFSFFPIELYVYTIIIVRSHLIGKNFNTPGIELPILTLAIQQLNHFTIVAPPFYSSKFKSITFYRRIYKINVI